jgi:hypothetical protein
MTEAALLLHRIGGSPLVPAGLYEGKLISFIFEPMLYFVPIILARTRGLEHESLSS